MQLRKVQHWAASVPGGARRSAATPPAAALGAPAASCSAARQLLLGSAGWGRGSGSVAAAAAAAAAGRGGGSGGACAAGTQRRSPPAQGSAAREEPPRRPRPFPFPCPPAAGGEAPPGAPSPRPGQRARPPSESGIARAPRRVPGSAGCGQRSAASAWRLKPRSGRAGQALPGRRGHGWRRAAMPGCRQCQRARLRGPGCGAARRELLCCFLRSPGRSWLCGLAWPVPQASGAWSARWRRQCAETACGVARRVRWQARVSSPSGRWGERECPHFGYKS